MTRRHALISGAGIAGPALAHQLAARGWRTTVVERFPERRDEGHNIDVRGAAREVISRMGIDDDVRAANTTEVGMRFIKDDGSAAASFPMDATGRREGITAELEILRGELSRILIEHTRDTTEYRFDTHIADLTDHGDHVTAVLTTTRRSTPTLSSSPRDCGRAPASSYCRSPSLIWGCTSPI